MGWRQPAEGQSAATILLAAWFRRECARAWKHYHGGELIEAPATRSLTAEIEDADDRHHRAASYASGLAEHDLDTLEGDYRRGDYSRSYGAVAEIAGHLRGRVRQGDQRFAAIAKEIMQANGLIATARQLWAQGDVSHVPDWAPDLPAALFPPQASSAAPGTVNGGGGAHEPVKPVGESLKALAERYLTERQRSVSTEWLASQRAIIKLFLEDAGERVTASGVNKRMAREWKERLMLFPSRGTIRGERLPFRQIVERNAAEGLPTLTTRTINKYLSAMCSLFDWLIRHEHCEHNPFDGLAIVEGDSEGARDPFSGDQLQKIFLSPLFIGCQSDNGRGLATPGPIKIRDWRYWLPLLGLFTGARPGELAQLTPSDISNRDGVDFITISSTGGRKIKTKNARRVIPIHATLIKLGFLAMVERARAAGHERLFAKIEPDSLGRHSSMPNDILNPYLKRIGIKVDARTCLYSLRHNFMDGLREAGYSDAEFAPLVGHGTTGPAVTSGYGAGNSLPIQRRQAMIEALRFGGLELAHLYE